MTSRTEPSWFSVARVHNLLIDFPWVSTGTSEPGEVCGWSRELRLLHPGHLESLNFQTKMSWFLAPYFFSLIYQVKSAEISITQNKIFIWTICFLPLWICFASVATYPHTVVRFETCSAESTYAKTHWQSSRSTLRVLKIIKGPQCAIYHLVSPNGTLEKYQFLQLSISGHLDSCFQFYKQSCCNYFFASLGVIFPFL